MAHKSRVHVKALRLQIVKGFLNGRYRDNKVVIQRETFILQSFHVVRVKGEEIAGGGYYQFARGRASMASEAGEF